MADKESATEKFMIQIDQGHNEFDFEKIRDLLEPAGVAIDKSYRPVCVNPKLGRYVIRGTADAEARKRAEQIDGIRFFRDLGIRSTQS